MARTKYIVDNLSGQTINGSLETKEFIVKNGSYDSVFLKDNSTSGTDQEAGLYGVGVNERIAVRRNNGTNVDYVFGDNKFRIYDNMTSSYNRFEIQQGSEGFPLSIGKDLYGENPEYPFYSMTYNENSVFKIGDEESIGRTIKYANDKIVYSANTNTLEIKDVTSFNYNGNEVSTVKYKVFTALLTQSGGDNDTEVTSGDLTIGVTYRINVDGTDADFTNVGAPNNNLNTSFVATGTTPNSWGTNGSLRFNSGAPVVTVLENTIGNVWFEYIVSGLPGATGGEYLVKSDGLFTPNKTVTFGDTYFYNVVSYWVNYGINDTNGVYIKTYDGNLSNDVLNNTPIEIRVYN
jgi:hypothetical protein